MDERTGVEVALAAADELGEAPHWLAETGELVRVDVKRGLVLGWRPGGGEWSMGVDGEIGAAIPRRRGGWVLAVERELILVDEGGARRSLLSVEPGLAANRFNDCQVDPSGTLWAGTMSRTRTRGAAALYRVAPDGGVERAVSGLTISNGLGWSPDGELLYHVDSTSHRIDLFDFDPAGSSLSGRRPFVSVDPANGMPDGLAIDAEGGVWVCLFGGGELRRYAPDGELDAAIRLPVAKPTCPAFGGPGLETLFVTTARHGRTPSQLRGEPAAGAVLALRPGVAGQPERSFAG
ncbi:MAG TPA: SMP-30/gluconolactonase/LRE family protein [Solirubrobacterales bacterium]|nr:SMP-30/gluconolactonase/LRE family protein [Solirubrobacterales bacterium]